MSGEAPKLPITTNYVSIDMNETISKTLRKFSEGYHEIIVTSEFILTRFYEYSLDKAYNTGSEIPFKTLNSLIGDSLYICGETILTEDDITTTHIADNCKEYVISGVLNSYYNVHVDKLNLFLIYYFL